MNLARTLRIWRLLALERFVPAFRDVLGAARSAGYWSASGGGGEVGGPSCTTSKFRRKERVRKRYESKRIMMDKTMILGYTTSGDA